MTVIVIAVFYLRQKIHIAHLAKTWNVFEILIDLQSFSRITSLKS